MINYVYLFSKSLEIRLITNE